MDSESPRVTALSARPGFKGSYVRGVCWRVFLGVLPAANATIGTWLLSLGTQRTRYDELCDRFLVDPHKQDSGDLLVNNPLAQEKDSAWTRYFELQALQKSIQIDLERLNPDDEFYHSTQIQERMLRILTVWACLNPHISYRQGMHELLAPICWVLNREQFCPDPPPTVQASEQQLPPHDPAITLFDPRFASRQWPPIMLITTHDPLLTLPLEACSYFLFNLSIPLIRFALSLFPIPSATGMGPSAGPLSNGE